jgi:hypothetical protein
MTSRFASLLHAITKVFHPRPILILIFIATSIYGGRSVAHYVANASSHKAEARHAGAMMPALQPSNLTGEIN